MNSLLLNQSVLYSGDRDVSPHYLKSGQANLLVAKAPAKLNDLSVKAVRNGKKRPEFKVGGSSAAASPLKQ